MAIAEMTEERQEEQELVTRQEALEQRVLLISPTLGWWVGRYQLPRKNTEVTTGGQTARKTDITTPCAVLMTDSYPVDSEGKSWKKRFTKINSKLSTIKEKFSVPFPIKGVRIIPKSRGREFMSELYGLTLGRLRGQHQRAVDDGQVEVAATLQTRINDIVHREQKYRKNGEPIPVSDRIPVFDYAKGTKIKDQSVAYQLHNAASEFCDNWVSIRKQIKFRNTMFNKVEHKVPGPNADMRSKFHLDVVPVELASQHAAELTQDDLDEHSVIVQEACQRRVEEAIDEMISGPRQQLAEALATLHELIQRDGRLTQRSFNPVRNAIAKVRMFDFVASDELLEQIKDMETRLNKTTPTALDSVTAANNGFSEAITAFMNEVQDEDRAATDSRRFGREFRSIDLD